MSEEDLAIFDLLTQSEPVLTDEERETVNASAKKLLEQLHDKIVQHWRRKVDVMNDVNSTIRRGLDQGLPEAPYTLDLFTSKVQLLFDHVVTAYGDDGDSDYPIWADILWPRSRLPTKGHLTSTRSRATSLSASTTTPCSRPTSWSSWVATDAR